MQSGSQSARIFLMGSRQRHGRGVEDRGLKFSFPSFAPNVEGRSVRSRFDVMSRHIRIFSCHSFQGQVVIDLNGGASSSAVRLVALCQPCFATVHRLKWSSLCFYSLAEFRTLLTAFAGRIARDLPSSPPHIAGPSFDRPMPPASAGPALMLWLLGLAG